MFTKVEVPSHGISVSEESSSEIITTVEQVPLWLHVRRSKSMVSSSSFWFLFSYPCFRPLSRVQKNSSHPTLELETIIVTTTSISIATMRRRAFAAGLDHLFAMLLASLLTSPLAMMRASLLWQMGSQLVLSLLLFLRGFLFLDPWQVVVQTPCSSTWRPFQATYLVLFPAWSARTNGLYVVVSPRICLRPSQKFSWTNPVGPDGRNHCREGPILVLDSFLNIPLFFMKVVS